MTNSTTTDKEQKSNATSAATGLAIAETSAPAKKTAPKSPSKSPAKSKVRLAAKAPAKATTKPAGVVAAEEEAATTDKIAKPKKAKLVRDGFTMPESEYDLLAAVKKRCLANGLDVKKSEVLRAAIISFAAQSDAAVTVAMQALDAIKTGRPPKGHK